MKTTRHDVEAVFALFVKSLGGHLAKNHSDIGGFYLDYAACYGGYMINQIINTAGAVSCPFGYKRRGSADMVSVLHFAMDVLVARI